MAEKQNDIDQDQILQEQRREEARQAFSEASADQNAEWIKGGIVGGMGGIHSVATEGVHIVRDVATDTVRAVGDVGVAVVDTAHNILIGVADGVRDVITHIIPFGAGRERRPPPSEHVG